MRAAQHTTLRKENLDELRLLRQTVLEEAEYGPGFVKPLFRYRSFPFDFGFPEELRQHRLGFYGKGFGEDPPMVNEEEASVVLMLDDSIDPSDFYSPYSFGDLAMGPAMYLPWFRKDGIEEILKYENDTKRKVFPRYVPYDTAIDATDAFCYRHFMKEQWIEEARNEDPGMRFPEEQASHNSRKEADTKHDFLRILTTPADQTRKRYELLRSGSEDPEDEATSADSMEHEVAANYNKGHGKEFLGNSYPDFIQEYMAISGKVDFTARAVEALRKKYIEQLYQQMQIEILATKSYAFYEEPPTWTIIFDGKPARSLTGEGFRYIHYLVSHMREEIGARDLNDILGIPTEALPSSDKNYGLDSKYDADAEGSISNGDLGSSVQEIGDEKYLRDLVMRRNQLRAELEKAQGDADLAEQERISNDNEKIEAMISDLLKPGGEERKFRGFKHETDKLRDRIGISIKRAVTQLLKHHEKAGIHFRETIKPYSNPLSYNPKENIKWHLK